MPEQSEIEELKQLLLQAKYPGVRAILERYLNDISPQPKKDVEIEELPREADPKKPVETSVAPPTTQTSSSSKPTTSGVREYLKYISVENFSWEQGSYNSPVVTVYVEIPDVGKAKDRVSVNFGRYSFDLTVHDVDGKNYRLVKDNLEKDIVPSESKFIVKKDKVVLKLQKVKGEYSYESWNQLTSKKPRDPVKEAERKKDPQGGLMDMMKDLYEDGDENMKKIIGEAMLKSQRGEKADPKPAFDSADDF